MSIFKKKQAAQQPETSATTLTAEEKAAVDAQMKEVHKANIKAVAKNAAIAAVIAGGAIAVYKVAESRDGCGGGCDTPPATPSDSDTTALCREYGMNITPGSYF